MAQGTVGRLYEIAGQHRAQLLANERSVAGEMVRVYGGIWQRVQGELADLQAEIDLARLQARLQGYAVDEAWLFRQERYQALLRQTEDELRRFTQYAEERVLTTEGDAIQAALAHAEEQVRVVTSRMGVSASWVRLPTGAIEDLVGFTANGSPLADLFAGYGESAAAAIRDGLLQGLALGQNPEDTARQIREAMGGDLARALRVSRTETLRTYREATRRSYEANDDVIEGWVWNCACTSRSCAMCVTGDTLVSGPLPQKVFARHYMGDIVVIQTASGKHLSITPNHPVLTSRGWVKAGLVKESDDVISSANSDGTALGIGIDNYQMPTLISEIAESFGVILAEMKCASPDFHGDGKGSEVYVVRANGFLGDELPPSTEQEIMNHGFALGSTGIQPFGGFIFPQTSGAATLLPRLLIRLGMILENLFPFSQGDFGRTDGLRFFDGAPGGIRYAQTGSNGKAVDAKGLSQGDFGFPGLITSGDLSVGQFHTDVSQSSVFSASNAVPLLFGAQQSTFLQDGCKAFPTDTELGRNLLGSLTGNVCLDRVVKIAIRSFSGHVYNLQTESGWYFSNGIITHNCWAMHGTVHPVSEILDDHPNGRCAMLPLVKRAPFHPESGVDQFARLDPSAQRGILGPLYDLYASGKIGLSDVVGRKFDPEWGPMRYVQSLAALKGKA